MIRRRGRRSSSGTRRKSRWEGTYSYLPTSSLSLVPTVADSSAVGCVWARVPAGTFDNINQQFVLDDCTVYRMLNSACFEIRANAAGNISVTVGMGIVAWDDIDDTPPPITDVPFPVQNGGFDWLWWWTSAHELIMAPSESLQIQNLLGPELMVSQKSQRKLSTGTGLLLVVEVYARISGMAAYFGWSHHGRYAVKMP